MEKSPWYVLERGRQWEIVVKSPDEKLRRVKPAGGSGLEGTKLIRPVYGVESTRRKNYSSVMGGQAGSWEERKLAEVSTKLN